MTVFWCRECLVVEVSPTARDGRCSLCRPSRRHSQSSRTDSSNTDQRRTAR